MAKSITFTAGIDTSKDKLDVAIHGQSGTVTVQNTTAGWNSLAARPAEAGVGRIGIEASGGYQRGVVRHLQKAGFRVVTLQPLQVKACARMRPSFEAEKPTSDIWRFVSATSRRLPEADRYSALSRRPGPTSRR